MIPTDGLMPCADGPVGAEDGAGLPEPPRLFGSGLITRLASSFGAARWNSRGPSYTKDNMVIKANCPGRYEFSHE